MIHTFDSEGDIKAHKGCGAEAYIKHLCNSNKIAGDEIPLVGPKTYKKIPGGHIAYEPWGQRGQFCLTIIEDTEGSIGQEAAKKILLTNAEKYQDLG